MALKQGKSILMYKCVSTHFYLLKEFLFATNQFSLYRNHFSFPKKNFTSEKKGINFNSDTNAQQKLSQIQLITEGIKKYKTNISISDLETLRRTVLASGNHINQTNFDALFITLCAQEKAFQLGKDYFNYIYSENNFNVGIIGKFFRLCYDCKEKCADNEKSRLIDMYKKLLCKYDVLDAKTCENVALGLSITSNWKECLKLLKMAHFTCVPSSKMYSTVVEAAFRNHEVNLAFNVLQDMMNNNRFPFPEVYDSWLYAFRFSNIGFQKIFEFFEKYDLHPSQQVVQLLLTYYDKNHIRSKYTKITTINTSGKCRSCFHQLNPLIVTELEFQKLKQAFLDPVLIGKDIFLKTKPSELKSFINFLKKIEHVDIVLDGLNIALSPAHRRTNVALSAKLLSNVVKHFVSQSKNILLLGRKHMNLWPALDMKYIKQNAFLFFVDDVSTDDPFLLYATMYFGLGTCFVSRDQMRNHKFLLKDPELISIFLKWQQKHQYYFLHANEDGVVFLKEPVPYFQNVQQSRKGIWHIPLSFELPGVPAHLVPHKRKWLCFHEN